MERILLRNRQDLSGQQFGRLAVQYPVEIRRNRHVVYVCRCACGTMRRVTNSNLTSGHTASCGCANPEATSDANGTHYQRRTSLYGRWRAMVDACERPKATNAAYYRDKGIRVCARWRRSFEDFAADVGAPVPGLILGRLDKEGDFEPDNVAWMPRKGVSKASPVRAAVQPERPTCELIC